MKVMLPKFVRGFALLATALLPTLEAVAQGPPGASGTAQVPGTYSHAPAYYDEPFVGYQSQTAFQTANQRDAAMTVFENNIGYQLRAPFGPQLNFNGIFGDRRGIEGNDYSVSGFLPWHIDPNRTVAFAILRGTATDLGDFVGNFGVGSRMYFEELNRILGFSLWYDIDDTHNQQYNRTGAQLEYLGRYLEVRAGADIVVGTSGTQLRSGFTGAPAAFQGNNVVFGFSRTQELAYDQSYLEAGGPMPFLGRYGVNGYGGAYFVWHDDADESLGYSLRASADVTRDVQVGVRHTSDDIFGHNTSVSVALSFPNGGIKQVLRSPRTTVRGQNPNLRQTNQVVQLRPGSVASLMSSNVVRDHRTPVNIETTTSNVLAIDPLTGAPVCVIHVDPNAAALGVGTFESPYRTLEAARLANDGSCRIIRVVPRGDNTGTNLVVSDTFGLFPNQRLLGSSFNHLFDTTRGTFTLPGFTGPGPGPLVTNAINGDVIRMTDGTEVSGLQIVGSATGNGIVGNINSFNINRNEIRDALNGVMLANAQGTGIIRENTITNSVVDGVNLTVTGGNQLNLMSSENLITGSGDDGTDVTVTASPLVAVFNRDRIGSSGDNGLEMTSTGMSTVTATLTGNGFGDGFEALGNGNNGFFFTADSGTANVIIGGPDPSNGNTFVGNMNDGVNFNLTGTALATLLAQNNTTISSVTQVGLNFTGTSFGDIPSGFPPDTMGSVGPNHIVELVNSAYAIYDKVTGAVITRISDEQFWINAGVPIVNGDTFDPRVIYDPQSGRWFATAIDRQGANSNTIYLAVSRTSDPTAGFQAVQFQADSAGARFNDFDMLGLDADGLYITTNNFNPGFVDTSLYSIPKADLLGAVPSLANLTRIENQPTANLPFRSQPVVDFGPSDGRGAILAASFAGGTTLQRLDVLGGGGAAATLSGPAAIAVPAYTAPVTADQPGPKQNLDTGNSGFASNVVEVGDSLWAVQSITDAGTGNVAIRWYEIDETTNAVLQTGTITDPDLDLYFPSIGVSPNGGVLIGYSGSSDNQFVSSYASAGRTSGGVTTFDAPLLLQAGVSDYQRIDGIGRNRWGDYSATVVDPIDPNTFWTFQEFVDGTDSYATQITQVRVGGAGGNGRNGINITATGTSMLTTATIDRNTLMDNGAAGLRINADGAAVINAAITNNIATRNGTGSFLTSTMGGTINTTVSGNTFDMNTDANTGFHALATGIGSVININAFTNNSASNNTNGNGARFESLAAGTVNLASFTGNTFTGNGMNGTFIRANGPSSVVAGAIGVNGGAVNTFANNLGSGIGLEASSGGSILGPGGIGNFAIVNNLITGNALGGITSVADSNILPPNNSVINLSIGGPMMGDGNMIQGNMDAGIIFRTRTFAKGTVNIENNLIDGTLDNIATMNPNDPMGDGIFLDRGDTSLLTATVLTNMSNNNANDGLRVISTGDDPTNASQPMSGMPNMVTFNGNTFMGNMRHGASFNPQADSVVVANGMLNTITGNLVDGIHIATTGDSGFGNPGVGVRSIFDGNTITGNTDDGVEVVSTNSSRVFLDIRSSDAVGLTSISGNQGDGVAIVHTSDRNSDIIVQSDPLIGNTMFRTLISGNGNATTGGNGIRVDNAAGLSTFTVQRTDINTSIAGAMDENGNGISLNVIGGAPTFNIGSPVVGGAIATLGLGNTVQVNANDALAVTVTDVGLVNAPTFNVAENIFGARIGELTGANGGHGVDFQVLEPTRTLFTSATPVSTFLDNVINRNALRGVNIFLRGDAGNRTPDGADMQFTFADGGTGGNQIMSNGQEGIFYEADPGIHQQRRVTLSNNGFPGNNRPAPFSLYEPFVEGVGGVQFTNAFDIGDDYFPGFLNLDTDNNSLLRITDNTIQNNGAAGAVGDGVYVRVGTNAYVAADVEGNTFGGNLLDDFRTESFITRDNAGTAIQTNASINRTGANTIDEVFLDDTAQFDLRFNNNTGNQVNTSAFGATYAADTLKTGVAVGRFTGLFQVDNGFALNAPNNTFTQFGLNQDIVTDIFNGGYFQRAAADPLFPNPAFPDDFPPGTFAAPFLP